MTKEEADEDVYRSCYSGGDRDPIVDRAAITAAAQRFCNEMPIENEPQDPEHGCDIGGPIKTTDPTRPSSSSSGTSDAQGNAELDRLIAETESEA